MLAREEFLLPYMWAQRQYRDDLYQMGSAAQLEDLFFDTLGAFTMQMAPGQDFGRRQGKEPWDYHFAGVELSHKEGITPSFTAVWQPGTGPTNNVPVYATWDYAHAITFVYTPLSVTAKWSAQVPLTIGASKSRTGSVTYLNHKTLDLSTLQNATVLLGSIENRTLTVERGWPLDEWRALTIHDVRALVGQTRLLDAGFWLDKTTRQGGLAGIPLEEVVFPLALELEEAPEMPGLFVFQKEDLQGVPLESNNKAHYVGRTTTLQLMETARAAGRYIPLPMWPLVFSDVTPPNLYKIQRAQYDNLFAARIH